MRRIALGAENEAKMNLLSRAEEIILLAVLHLKESAYGVSIQEFILEKTGLEWSFAQIYDPLSKLVRKGYVRRSKGDSTSERGGRFKYIYSITLEGRAALADIRRVHDRVWAAVPEESQP